ncbi:MAG: Cysteine-rich secretory protein family [Thermoleophilaceae bacterium]|jgi:uncharacterized protein YkwD|nr:Cysteine-rich secretory protein family [Thermoleophilaceae bacterium]
MAAIATAWILLGLVATANASTATERAEDDMVAAINEVRSKHGMDGFRRSDSLTESAGGYSRWLMAHDTFSHAGRIQASDAFLRLGEALELHSGRRFKVRATLSRWMGSASHRAIILSRTMPWIGTGVTRGRYGAMAATIWVLHVGRLKPAEPNLPAPGPPLP